jgi:hypothetical protein
MEMRVLLSDSGGRSRGRAESEGWMAPKPAGGPPGSHTPVVTASVHACVAVSVRVRTTVPTAALPASSAALGLPPPVRPPTLGLPRKRRPQHREVERMRRHRSYAMVRRRLSVRRACRSREGPRKVVHNRGGAETLRGTREHERAEESVQQAARAQRAGPQMAEHMPWRGARYRPADSRYAPLLVRRPPRAASTNHSRRARPSSGATRDGGERFARLLRRQPFLPRHGGIHASFARRCGPIPSATNGAGTRCDVPRVLAAGIRRP